MNVLVLDIETNMAHDTIWCCAYHSNWFFPSMIHVDTPEFIAGLKSAIKGADVIVA